LTVASSTEQYCKVLTDRCRCVELGVWDAKDYEPIIHHGYTVKNGKGSLYSITERRVPELIPILGRQPAGDMSHKPGDRLPLLPATLNRAAASFAAW